MRDLQAGTTTLVSRASGPGGAGGDSASTGPAISADGRFVAFESSAENLSDEDSAGTSDVFVRDLQTSTTTLASRANGPGGAGGDGTSFSPSISADGRHVAFESTADNLSAEDDDAVNDVFVRDLQGATTTLASRAAGAGGAGGDGTSGLPAISADGRFVAFSSDADNLSAEDADAVLDVFVRDLQAATHHPGQPGGRPGGRRRQRQLPVPGDLGRRALRGVPVARRQPRGRRRQRRRQHLPPRRARAAAAARRAASSRRGASRCGRRRRAAPA